MMRTHLILGLALMIVATACSKTDSNTPTPTAQGRYLVMSNDAASSTGAGYLSAYADVPRGTISNVGAN